MVRFRVRVRGQVVLDLGSRRVGVRHRRETG